MARREAAEVLTYTMVEGRCMDCLGTHRGSLGVRFLETDAGAGLEVVICEAGFTHSLARVQFSRIPVVEVKGDLNIHGQRGGP